MEQKYELLKNDFIKIGKRKLYRIRSLKEFTVQGYTVKCGDLGGYIESTNNLSQLDNCWVLNSTTDSDNNFTNYGNTCVYDDAYVSDDALVHSGSRVYGYAKIYNTAEVTRKSKIFGYAEVYEDAYVEGSNISGETEVCGSADIDNSKLKGYTVVKAEATIETSKITDATIIDNAHIEYSTIIGDVCINNKTQVVDCFIKGCINN